MIQAQQVSVTRTPIPYSTSQVRPGQIPVTPTTTVSPGGFEDITTMITSIMPLIMLVLMFQMLKPLLAGMGSS